MTLYVVWDVKLCSLPPSATVAEPIIQCDYLYKSRQEIKQDFYKRAIK